MRAAGSHAWSGQPSMRWIATSVIAVGAVVLFVAAVPALHDRHGAPSAPVAVGLAELGLSASLYAAYWTGVLVAFAVLCLAVAGTVLWRRPGEPMAWLVALFLVLVGCANAPTMEALAWRYPSLGVLASAANLALVACILAVLITFPDGRPVPRHAAPVGAAAVAALVVLGWGKLGEDLPGLWYSVVMVAFLAGLAAQVHRFRRVSGWEQRQQTKWVVAATSVAVIAQVAFPILAALPTLSEAGPGALLGDLLGVTGVTGGYAVLVVSMGVAVLRHRLWDVDVVVNRTLVYGALTMGVLALYAVVVVAADRVLRSPGELGASLLAAGAVALVFAPSRDRLQRGVNRLMYGQRDEPYQVLTELGRQLRTTIEPDSVLPTIVDTVRRTLRLPYAALTLGPDPAADTIAASGCPVGGVVRIPLVHHNETVGALLVSPRSPDEPFHPADRSLLEDLAVQAAPATAAVRLASELAHARQQRILALEEERRRLRRDLHDGLGPALASMTLQAELAGELVARDPAEAARLLGDLTHQLQSSTGEIRRLVYDLRPPALDDLGLPGAVRRFVDSARSPRLEITLDTPPQLPTLPAAAEVAAYRIVQEGVTNALRHSGARTCHVGLRLQAGTLVVEVEDDGTGPPEATVTGVGLRSMRERSAELGGRFAFTAGRRGGSLVRAELPLATAPSPRP